MPAESLPLASRKPTARSRVTNGSAVLPEVDGRSLVARRYRDISNAILVDQGGADQCSESRLQLIRRFAAAAVLAEQLESKLANGEQIDIAQHATLSSTLVRLASRIGIDRMPRDVTPTLAQYLASRDSGEPEDEGEVEPDAKQAAVGKTLASELSKGAEADAMDDPEASG
jgi:hypothetical protein